MVILLIATYIYLLGMNLIYTRMEQWEIDYRQELQDTLENKAYPIGIPGSPVRGWTGKGGQIEFMVAMRKEAMKTDFWNKWEDAKANYEKPAEKAMYKPFTEADVRKHLMDIFNGK